MRSPVDYPETFAAGGNSATGQPEMRYMLRTCSNRYALAVLLALVLVRGGVIACLPEAALSSDLHAWCKVVKDLAAGWNPYQTTFYLSWPPLWMQLLYGVSLVARLTGIALPHAIQWFLVCGEAILALVALAFLRGVVPDRQAMLLVLLGIVLNPVAVFLVCQHANFDVLVGLLCLLAVIQVAQYVQKHDPADWLLAALFLGLGILLKTVPVVLAPLLFADVRKLPSAKYWFLGMVLVLGPAALGLSVLLPLAPDAVILKVLGYRSSPGWFGLSGVMAWFGWERWYGVYGAVYAGLLAYGMIGLARRFAAQPLRSAPGMLSCAALLLMSIPVIGPGYAPQYAYWFLPLLLLAYPGGSPATRCSLRVLYAVAGITYAIEYAGCSSHGAWLLQFCHPADLVRWAAWLSAPGVQTGLRMPLFLVLGVTMVHLSRDLTRAWASVPGVTGRPERERQACGQGRGRSS